MTRQKKKEREEERNMSGTKSTSEMYTEYLQKNDMMSGVFFIF